jgi:putative hydroxymethylpyrimidine transport system ATP-binding protein
MISQVSASAGGPAQSIQLREIRFGFPGQRDLFAGLSLTLSAGITAILGESGLGKTTLLRLIAGRLVPSAGAILGAGARRIAWMGQSGALLPWASAEDNVLMGARLRGEPLDRAKAREILAQVGLAGHERKRPAQLSGGMRQRVALARALFENAAIALLDEPFAHLDAVTKGQLYRLAARAFENRIAILVTHDPWEALALAHRIVVLQGDPTAIAADVAVDGSPPRDVRDPALDAVYRRIMAAMEGA